VVDPAVTVLMAVFDPPLRMLGQAVDSILEQSFADFEFLIVDDGSRDPEVGAFLAGQADRDSRIRIVPEPHKGLTASLNRGLALARGKWIARQDADDWSEADRLKRQVDYFRKQPHATVVGTSAWTHQQDGRRLWQLRLPTDHPSILGYLPRGNPFVHGSVMFPRTAALAAGGYREAFQCSQDYDFLWRLAERGAAANLPEPLYHYRYTNVSVSAARAQEQARAHRAIQKLAAMRQAGEPEQAIPALAQAAPGEKTRALLKQADHRMLAGDYRGAWAGYRRLLRAHPGNLLAWGKLARLGVFWAFPTLREACFRGTS
jgi:glycosyltransferase involved in cell wall biosynthesis